MTRKNYIYEKVLKEYQEKQDKLERTKDKKLADLYEKIPMLKKIEKDEKTFMLKVARQITLGKKVDYEDQLEDFRLAKIAQLINYGYSPDYLEAEYECQKCKDTGFIGSEECSCFKQKITKEYYKMSNLDKLLKKQNFQTFDFNIFSDTTIEEYKTSPRKNIEEIVNASRKFIRKFEDEDEYNLLFYGTTGLGKTFMINCIAKELLDLGYTVIYQTAHKLMDLVEEYKFEKTDSILEAKKRYNYLLEADLLIIDDLGTEVANAFTTSEIFNIINSRNLGNKKMLISTNLTPGEISKIYTDRVYSRILDRFDIYKFIGDDLRWKGY